MEFTVTSGGLAAGAYQAEFIGCAPYDEHTSEYGPAVMLKWKVLSGAEAGNEASRICSAKLTPKSALGKMAVALKGSPVVAGERFNFASYFGTKGTLLVEPTDNGGSKVSTFLKQA